MFNALILVASALLFVYWFRYTCRLILSTRTAKDFSVGVARANRLEFPEIQQRLADEPEQQFDDVLASIHRDYRLLMYLFSHSGDLARDGQLLERRMLIADYWVMRAWYRLTRQHSAGQARKALDELAQIVSHFANTIGEQLAASAA